MKLAERYQVILEVLEQHNPNPETELNYASDFQLLVSVILSAQCTDKRVNLVTPLLFASYPTAASMSLATYDDIFALIKSISYPNSKTHYLLDTSQQIMSLHQGKVPTTMQELTALAGVGRKTANVVLSVLHQEARMAVDTHVFRVSHRLGLVSKNDTTPLAVEKKLIKYIPKEKIHKAHHWLILHGRYTCLARKPLCERCMLKPYCPSSTKIILQKNMS